MKKVLEYNGSGDPVFFSTIRKAYNQLVTDFGNDEDVKIPAYRTVQNHIRNNGLYEVRIQWLGDYVAIIKREVL